VSLKTLLEGFRRLMTVALVAGLTSGAVLAVVQFYAIRPMIQRAEVYEAELRGAGKLPPDNPLEWQPTDGLERVGYTLAATLLLGVGYAALVFGLSDVMRLHIGVREGLLLGLAAFACVSLAPSVGLPPKPPGVEGAELNAAQTWWTGTACATAIGLALMALARGRWIWIWRLAGVLVILLPHLVGPPPVVPPLTESLRALSVRFAAVSVATQGVFWVVLGTVGGWCTARASAQH
jgi:cobalt transporter subunit CbtA